MLSREITKEAREEMQNDIKKVLSYSISKDYIQAILKISEENSGSTLIDKIADNVFETSAWTDEGIWSNDDIRMAIGRVLLSRLNANSPAVPLELLTIGSEYTISLKALFEALSEEFDGESVATKYGYIEYETDRDREYFDFKTKDGIPCMDGETCEVIEITPDYIVLQEEDEKLLFKLSKENLLMADSAVCRDNVD